MSAPVSAPVAIIAAGGFLWGLVRKEGARSTPLPPYRIALESKLQLYKIR
jgi:hypothetical protein